eukprot:scaffold439810_cov52-Prasinocladus_malaysianus.AAC.1
MAKDAVVRVDRTGGITELMYVQCSATMHKGGFVTLEDFKEGLSRESLKTQLAHKFKYCRSCK